MAKRRDEKEVILSDFFYNHDPLLKQYMGWWTVHHSPFTREESHVEFLDTAELNNIMFYHVRTGRLYALHFERCPFELREHELDTSIPCLCWQVEYHSWEGGRVLQVFHNREEMWQTLRVDGCPDLHTLIEESYLGYMPIWQKLMDSRREVVLPNWHGPNRHLYADELCMPRWLVEAARTYNPLKGLRYMLNYGYNVWLFDPVTRVYWGIHNERWPMPLGRLPYDASYPFEEGRWDLDTHRIYDDAVVCLFRELDEILHEPILEGRTIEQVAQEGMLDGSF